MKSGIYTITNTLSGKLYVGCAINIDKRWQNHRSELNKKKHHCKHLQAAWNKYGEKAFIFEILVECEEQFLYSEEHYWCNLLQVHDDRYGYNMRPTNPEGKQARLSEEHKLKIGKSNKGKVRSEITKAILREYRLKQICPTKGRKMSEKHKEKLRQITIQRGIEGKEKRKIIKEEKKQKKEIDRINKITIKEKLKEEKRLEKQKNKINKQIAKEKLKVGTGNYIRKRRPIQQYNKYGEYINTYSSAKEASEQLGIKEKTIFAALKRSKTTKNPQGYIWRYAIR